MKILQVFSLICLVTAIVLFVLHFTNDIEAYWFSISIAVGAIINLISSIILAKKKKNDKLKNMDSSVDNLKK